MRSRLRGTYPLSPLHSNWLPARALPTGSVASVRQRSPAVTTRLVQGPHVIAVACQSQKHRCTPLSDPISCAHNPFFPGRHPTFLFRLTWRLSSRHVSIPHSAISTSATLYLSHGGFGHSPNLPFSVNIRVDAHNHVRHRTCIGHADCSAAVNDYLLRNIARGGVAAQGDVHKQAQGAQ